MCDNIYIMENRISSSCSGGSCVEVGIVPKSGDLLVGSTNLASDGAPYPQRRIPRADALENAALVAMGQLTTRPDRRGGKSSLERAYLPEGVPFTRQEVSAFADGVKKGEFTPVKKGGEFRLPKVPTALFKVPARS